MTFGVNILRLRVGPKDRFKIFKEDHPVGPTRAAKDPKSEGQMGRKNVEHYTSGL